MRICQGLRSRPYGYDLVKYLFIPAEEKRCSRVSHGSGAGPLNQPAAMA